MNWIHIIWKLKKKLRATINIPFVYNLLRGCSKQNYRENYWVLLNKRKRNSVLFIFRLALIGLQTTGPRPQLFKRWIVLDSAIHRINLYPLDSTIIGFPKYLSTLFIRRIVRSSFWATGARSVNGSVNSKHACISGVYKSHIDYVNIVSQPYRLAFVLCYTKMQIHLHTMHLQFHEL